MIKKDRKGKNNPMFGKKHSKEIKAKMSKNHIDVSGINNPRYGKHCSEETKEKIRKSKLGKPSWNKGTKQLKTTGSKHPNWKGGITDVNTTIRQSTEMKNWRKYCMKRDNFTCQKSGQYGGKLVVHHINNFADFPELRFDINNGITLSEQSHKKFHNLYGKKNNTREQLIEFLNNK